MKITKKIAFLGVGNMAGAIIDRLISGGIADAGNIGLFDINSAMCARFGDCPAFGSAAGAVGFADIVVLSSKPQNIPDSLAQIRECPDFPEKLYVSLAAGVTIETLRRGLGEGVRIIRTMPNAPMMTGCGVTAMCRADGVSDGDFACAKEIFESLGRVLTLPEYDMNKIISVISSSPAYVYSFIRAIYNGATAQGLGGCKTKSENYPAKSENCKAESGNCPAKSGDCPPLTDGEIFESICAVLEGSVALMRHLGKTPDEMISIIASPGGTTEAAMKHLGDRGFEMIINEAMQHCTNRADELSENSR